MLLIRGWGHGLGGLAVCLLLPVQAVGYRPFVSTDAAVADPKEVEIELGYFQFARSRDRDVFSTPKVVLNYGLLDQLEIVGEFAVETAPSAQLVDPALFLKAVLKEGVLQEKDGLSVAIEVGPLLPSTARGESGVGVEATGIVSGRLQQFAYHVNAGAGVDRVGARLFGIWGVIVEVPIVSSLRLVGEVNGESVEDERPNNSALLGVIWRPFDTRKLWIDTGFRRGISRAAPDWQVTLGLTVGFSVVGGPKMGLASPSR